MLTLYTAVGTLKFQKTTGGKSIPLVINNGQEYGLSDDELLLWSCLAFQILTLHELQDAYTLRQIQKEGPKGLSFQHYLNRLSLRGLVVSGIGLTGVDALYRLLGSLTIIPLKDTFPIRLFGCVQLYLEGTIGAKEFGRYLKKKPSSPMEDTILKLADKVSLTTAELVTSMEQEKVIHNESDIMDELYTEPETTYQTLVLNTINFKKSMRYNPFVYIRSEKDVLKVVNTLIVNTVEWWNAKGRYDLVYKSRVFTDTYSKDTITVTNAEQVIFGGTGYDTKNRLPPEVEHSYPDYSIYPQFFGIAYGFLSRGCPRNCGFCIVSSKEGRKSVKVADLSEFWKWQPEIKIMDANLLACPDHENLIEQLIRSRAWVDFSQGLDIRLVNRDNVSLLNRVRIKAVHFAWDNPDEDLTGYFQRFLDLTAIKSSRQRRVYVLTNYGSTHEQDLYRVNTLRATRIFSPPLKKRPPSRLHLSRSQTAQMGISV